MNSGAGAGNNISGGIEFGFFKGDTNTFSGQTLDASVGYGSGTFGAGIGAVFNMCREPIGTTLSFGPSFPGLSYSVGSSVTGLVGKTNGESSTVSCKPCDSQ